MLKLQRDLCTLLPGEKDFSALIFCIKVQYGAPSPSDLGITNTTFGLGFTTVKVFPIGKEKVLQRKFCGSEKSIFPSSF